MHFNWHVISQHLLTVDRNTRFMGHPKPMSMAGSPRFLLRSLLTTARRSLRMPIRSCSPMEATRAASIAPNGQEKVTSALLEEHWSNPGLPKTADTMHCSMFTQIKRCEHASTRLIRKTTFATSRYSCRITTERPWKWNHGNRAVVNLHFTPCFWNGWHHLTLSGSCNGNRSTGMTGFKSPVTTCVPPRMPIREQRIAAFTMAFRWSTRCNL